MIEVMAAQNLDAFRRKAVRIIDARPERQRLGRSPPQFTNGRSRIGNPEIGPDARGQKLAGNPAAIGCHGVSGNRRHALRPRRTGASRKRDRRGCKQAGRREQTGRR